MRRLPIFESLTRPTILFGSKVKLRPKHLQDAANDYRWRRDSELCRLDAAITTSISFDEYSKDYAEALQHTSQSQRFAIETLDGKHIGNCSYFSIDEIKREAEFGIMIGDRNYWNQGYGTDVIPTLLNHIFSQTKLERIYLKTLNWNIRAQKCFEKCGFVPCGHLVRGDHNFIIMEIHRPPETQKQTK